MLPLEPEVDPEDPEEPEEPEVDPEDPEEPDDEAPPDEVVHQASPFEDILMSRFGVCGFG